MKPPAAVSGDKLKARLGAHLSKAKTRDSVELMRDPVYFTELGDINWHLQELIDNRQSLAGFEAFGLTPRPDGSVDIDIKNFPEWAPLPNLLRVLATPKDVDDFAIALRDRGFEDEDFAALKTYISENDRKRLMAKANKHLLEHYAGIVRSKRGASLDQAKAHRYRVFRSANEVNRAWADGLMKSLRPQAQRILQSTLEETHQGLVLAPERVDEALWQEMSYIRSDAYLKSMQDMEKELAQ